MHADDPYLFDVSLHDFEARVLAASASKPILVDFWAQWCQPCIVIAPLLAQIVQQYQGAICLAKLEVDQGENMKLAGKYQVRGFPSIVLFQHKLEIARFSGAQPKQKIQAFIQQHTGLTP